MHVLLALVLAGGPAVSGPVSSSASGAVSTAVVGDPCKGQLDAAVVDGVRCQSPVHAETAPVAADEKAPLPPLARDPAIFPGELGFVATILGLAGSAAVVVAVTRDDGRLSADDEFVNGGVFVGGVSVIGLAGLVAGAAVSTWVFDPATAQLKLPLFEGEPR